MMKEPWFWRERSLAARVCAASLAPGAFLYDAVRRFNAARVRPVPAPAPVICIGGATLGGAGKTPFALMAMEILRAENIDAHFLTRGYGGALSGPVRADTDAHSAADIGDEALLLARAAPSWISRDRPAGAALAAAAGAQAIIMDDGFQNPSLEKTFSVLLSNADHPYGNNRAFPAGPLREPVSDALARADALATVHPSREAALAAGETENATQPRFEVWLEPDAAFAPGRLVAFCGIGRPERFFAMLKRHGCDVVEAVGFPDHHVYAPAELSRLRSLARKRSARLITTEKDMMRLAPEDRAGVEAVAVAMACHDRGRLTQLMLAAIADFQETARGVP